MSAKSNDSGQWQPCPPGEIGSMSNRLQRQRRLHLMARATAVSTILLLAVVGIYVRFGGSAGALDSGGFNFGGITCSEIHRVLPELKAGTLDDKTLARVRAHIERCPHCKSFARFLRDPLQTGDLPCTDPQCPWHSRSVAAR